MTKQKKQSPTGEDDRAILRAFAVGSFRDMRPNGSVTIVPGAGHVIQEDAPDLVTALMARSCR